jgi:predicted MFS family arabinose efflux permease
VFFDVAYQSYLPALVDREDILEGNSKLEISRSAAQIAGPGVSGFLIGIVTAPVAVVLDSISFLVSGLFVWLIRRPEPLPERAGAADGTKGPGMRTEIAEGLRYVLRHPYLRNIAACTGTSNFFSNIVFSILVLYLLRDLGFTPEILGIVFSIGSIGFLLGALTANKIGSRIGVGPTIVLSAIVFGPSAIPVALAPASASFALGSLVVPLDLVFVAAAIFLGSFGGSVYNINQVSLRQAITPERMQGRMNATMRFIVWGTIPLGAILGGFLGGAIGLHETSWVGAIGGVFSFVPVLLSRVRSLKEMPGPDDPIIGEAVDETPRPVIGSPRASLDEE